MEANLKIKVADLQDAIAGILRDYGDVVYEATEEGLDAAEKVLIKNLKAASPKKTGEFAKSWKSKGKKYKLVRIVGNTKTVPAKKGKEIPLANILEYSPVRGKPFIKDTYYASIEEMAAAVVAEIKKEA